jgi:hypothetical protein
VRAGCGSQKHFGTSYIMVRLSGKLCGDCHPLFLVDGGFAEKVQGD